MSIEPLFERLRELGGGPGSPNYFTACAAIDAIRVAHGALDDIANATFSTKDGQSRYAREQMRAIEARVKALQPKDTAG